MFKNLKNIDNISSDVYNDAYKLYRKYVIKKYGEDIAFNKNIFIHLCNLESVYHNQFINIALRNKKINNIIKQYER